MSKEMVVSANPHETRVAILEDGLVTEVFFERERSYSLAGSIYKGRVTRILPGMQSAFVNIGLERDAFLYVSDFLEGLEDYDQLVNSLEERMPPRGRPQEEPEVIQAEAGTGDAIVAATPDVSELPPVIASTEPDAAASEANIRIEALPGESISPPNRAPQAERPQGDRNRDGGRGRDRGRFGRRGRRGGQRGKGGFPDSKYAREGAQPQRHSAPAAEISAPPVLNETSAIDAPVERVLLPGESLAKYRDWARPSDRADRADQADQATQLTPDAQTPLEIARENVALEAVHEEEIEAMAAQISESETVAEPEAQSAISDEPIEQEAPEVLIEPHAFVPRAFDPEAFEASSSAAATSEPDLAEISEAAMDELKQDVAGAGIEWESRDEQPEGAEAELTAEADAAAISEQAADESEPNAATAEEASSAPAGEAREAVVREGGRNARLQRRQRWQARRGGGARRDVPRRDGGVREPGRRPQRPQGEAQRQSPRPLIGDMLKEGQEIIVQIAKEPLGKKGARITSHIALPGRYVVYMPTLNHVGVSRKVSSDEERQRLKRIVLDAAKNFAGGFIVRTAGDGRSEEDIRQDVQYLTKLWLDIKAKAEKSSAPALLHHDPDLVLRTLRDQLSPEYTTIWVDNEQVYEQILLMVQKFQPALVGRVRLYTKDVPLFEETGVQEEINKALKPKVWLKSGGYIVINQTEALVAIDVNTGKFVGKSNRLEDTIVKTNLEAIQEIVRQIRLRDLGGIIVIDFIDMDERKNRAKVMAELEEAVKSDRSPSKILSFNEFGLVAITRKRVRQSLERAICQPCAYCTGSGMVKSPSTVSLEILAEAKKQASELHGKQITIRVNPEVGKTLKSIAAGIIDSIEETTGKGVIIRNDPSVHMENFYFD